MNVTLLIMLVLACILTGMAYMKNPQLPLQGFRAGGKLFWSIVPTLIIAFIAAGMIGEILPRDLMTRWLGEESGLRGLIVATFAGSVTPRGPFVQFPIVAALLKSISSHATKKWRLPRCRRYRKIPWCMKPSFTR